MADAKIGIDIEESKIEMINSGFYIELLRDHDYWCQFSWQDDVCVRAYKEHLAFANIYAYAMRCAHDHIIPDENYILEIFKCFMGDNSL